jgi:PAS domain S-box-containing protein
MWIYDLNTLRFLDVNKATVAKYGYSRDEFLAMTIADIRPREDRATLVADVAAVSESRNEAGVWRHRLKSGEIIHADITSHIIDHEGRSARLVAARDVTDRFESEAALARAKRMLEIAGHSAKFGAWRYCVRRDCLEWSTETARIHDEPDGFSPTVADGIAYHVPEHRERMTALFHACRDQGTPWRENFQIITAKGRKLWVRSTGEAEYDIAGNIIVVQGSFQDISEEVTVRRRAEEAEGLLEIAGRVVKLGGWRVDLQSEEVTWTDGTAAIHELPPGAAPTLKGGVDYFAPEERDTAWQVFQECVQHGTTFDNVREVITAKGNSVQVRSIGVPVRDDTARSLPCKARCRTLLI